MKRARKPRRARGLPLLMGRLACVAVVAMIGCRGRAGPERVAVSGKVTFRGQSVEDGQIRFVPQAGTMAPVTIAPIRHGVYDAAASGGVPVGTHRVELRAYDPNEPAPQGPGMPPRKQLLPPNYNVDTQIAITVESGTRTITKNFELTEGN
jgi:hypothetical protein